MPSLKMIVHDDACHLRLVAESQKDETDLSKRLATDMSCIVDVYHAPGHVGEWCAEHCLPGLARNQRLLRAFPTNICETVNSDLSPLGHTIHHMGRWVCQLAASEMVDVKKVQEHRKKKKIASRKRARDSE